LSEILQATWYCLVPYNDKNVLI